MVFTDVEEKDKSTTDKNIWTEDEVEADHFDDRDLDPRPCPEYV